MNALQLNADYGWRLNVQRTAILSPGGKYRYLLSRTWDENKPPAIWIMLNPSVADASIDDATQRLICERAYRLGRGGVITLNLFAYRATDPKDMLAAWQRNEDVIGSYNNLHLANILALTKGLGAQALVFVGWGDGAEFMESRIWYVADQIKLHGLMPYCLGTTASGQPRHPLRIPYVKVPEPWRWGPLAS